MLRSNADGNPFCRLARIDGPQAQTVETLSYRDFLDCNHPKRDNGAPCSPPLVPAKAGTQTYGLRPLDSRFRGNERNFASPSITSHVNWTVCKQPCKPPLDAQPPSGHIHCP